MSWQDFNTEVENVTGGLNETTLMLATIHAATKLCGALGGIPYTFTRVALNVEPMDATGMYKYSCVMPTLPGWECRAISSVSLNGCTVPQNAHNEDVYPSARGAYTLHDGIITIYSNTEYAANDVTVGTRLFLSPGELTTHMPDILFTRYHSPMLPLILAEIFQSVDANRASMYSREAERSIAQHRAGQHKTLGIKASLAATKHNQKGRHW